MWFYQLKMSIIRGETSPQKSPIAKQPDSFCGDIEIRTLDPLLAKQMLYQLSYTPEFELWMQIYEKNLNCKNSRQNPH